jgi:hypothetical protein
MAVSGVLRQYYAWVNGPTSGPAKTTQNKAELTVIFEWSIYNQSVRTNSSDIAWAVKVQLNSLANINAIYESWANDFRAEGIIVGNSGSGSAWTDFVLSIDGEQISYIDDFAEDLLDGKTVTVKTGTTNIKHDADGNKTAAIDTRVFIREGFLQAIIQSSSTNNRGHNLQLTGNIILDRITRNAVIETFPTSFNDEQSPTITYHNPAGEFAVQLKAGISISNGARMEIPYRNISKTAESYTFEFTEEEKATLYAAVLDKNRTDAPARFYIFSEVPTVDGTNTEEYISYRDGVINFINYYPTLDVLLVDTNERSTALTGNPNIFVRNVSDVAFDLGARAYKGAAIEYHFIQNGDQINNKDLIGTLTSITDNVFYVSLTDNRGYGDYKIITKSIENGEFIDYFPLTCTVKNEPLDANGSLQVKTFGKYFQGNFGAASNTLTIEYKIKRLDKDEGDGIWISRGVVNPTMDYEGNYTYEFPINGLDYTGRYELQVRAIDAVMTNYAVTSTIVAAQPLFDWGPEDFAFHVPVTINGWQVDTVVEESTGEIGFYEDASGLPQYGGYEWTFRKWSSGLMECWCSIDISTAVSNAWGNLYTSGRLIKTNLLFPREFAEVPVVTATLAAGYAGGILMTTGSSSKPVTTYSAGTLEIARGGTASTTQYNYKINYNVKGRWK